MKLKTTKKKSMNSGMVMEYNIGSMELIMKANGIIIRLKAKVHSIMLKVTYIEENLGMIWLMDMENIFISMAANIKVNLKTMYRKDTEKKNGLMELNMLGPIRTE